MTLSSTSKLIAAFVILIIGVVLVVESATIGLTVTAKSSVDDESFDYTVGMLGGSVNETDADSNLTMVNTPTSWKILDCPLTGIVVKNGSGDETWTLDTDYNVYAASGIVTILNTTLTNTTNNVGNTTLIDYTYCGDDYMNLTWGRTSINLVPGFFAIALLLISVGLFYSVAKEHGIIN